jgi:glycosyltransferase involved in cell wall biosynthesis
MPNLTPLVSIVIPVYNRAALVERAIRSALEQTYGNIEVVISDNCSTDGTFEVAQQFARQDPRVVAHKNIENLGPVKNWIKGIQVSRGEFVHLLFSDDWLEPECIERMMAPLLKDPAIGFCFSGMEAHDADRRYTKHVLKPGGRMRSTEFMHRLFSGSLDAPPVTPDCAIFRKEEALRFIPEHIPPYIGFDLNQRGIGHDVTLYLRTCERYPYCYHYAEPFTHCLEHSGSFSVIVGAEHPGLLDWCYIHAYWYFLRDTKLSRARKLRLAWDLIYYSFRLRVLQGVPLARKVHERLSAGTGM